ncbi:MAG: hypothetical protein LC624_04020 [Halobacteriales archaeon]|nr:hypothetical protein [Halobacteriales archaeon]
MRLLILPLLAALAATALPALAVEPCTSAGPAQACLYTDPSAPAATATADTAGVHVGSYLFTQPARPFVALCANAEPGSGPGVYVLGSAPDGGLPGFGAGVFTGPPPC